MTAQTSSSKAQVLGQRLIDASAKTREGFIASLIGEKILPLSSFADTDARVAESRRVIDKLKNRLNIEVKRGQTGSWLYDINRHLNLCAAVREEGERLSAI